MLYNVKYCTITGPIQKSSPEDGAPLDYQVETTSARCAGIIAYFLSTWTLDIQEVVEVLDNADEPSITPINTSNYFRSC